MPEFEKETHPSYGMLRFTRVNGGSRNLFGSSIPHQNTIRLTLCKGNVERTLNTDFYSAGGQIAEVEMSYSQFAELIGSMNVGNGVPVTIKWLQGEGQIENCPYVDKRMLFEKEFKAKLDSTNETANQLVSEVKDLFNEKKSLTKKDKEEILAKLARISREINENSQFVYEQFNEQMDKTVSEAKGEVDAFVVNKINSIAQKSIIEQLSSDISTPKLD